MEALTLKVLYTGRAIFDCLVVGIQVQKVPDISQYFFV
jgi:hypothetical protein